MAKKYFDFSPFLDRSFDKASRGGALADIFEATGDTLNNYGENKDEKLLSSLANVTDKNKIDNTKFYNPLNALTAQKVVDKNIDRNYTLGQRAKEEADYAIEQYTKTALNDVMTMSKEDWDNKYKNVGGLDFTKTNNAWNQKEDRNYTLEQREKKEQEDRIRKQRENQKWVDYNNAKKQQNYDNKALIAYQTGEVKSIDELKASYPNVSANTLLGISKEIKAQNNINNLNNIASKYNSWDEFKNSEDWKTASYDTKVTLGKNKIWGSDAKDLTFDQQIKQEKINYNKQDLPNIMKQYEDKTGKKMTVSQQSNFVYDGKLPSELEPVKVKEKTPLTTKEAKDLDGLVKYANTLNQLENSYDSSYVGGVDSTLNSISPNAFLSDGHRKFNTLMNDVLLGKTSALAGTLSDRDMALLSASGISDTLGEKDFKESLNRTKEQVQKLIKERYDLLSNSYEMPEHYNYIKDTKLNDNTNKQPKIKKSIVKKEKNILKTGTTKDGRKVIQYDDGSVEYAN